MKLDHINPYRQCYDNWTRRIHRKTSPKSTSIFVRASAVTEGSSSRTTFIFLTWDGTRFLLVLGLIGDVCNLTEKDLRFGKPWRLWGQKAECSLEISQDDHPCMTHLKPLTFTSRGQVFQTNPGQVHCSFFVAEKDSRFSADFWKTPGWHS